MGLLRSCDLAAIESLAAAEWPGTLSSAAVCGIVVGLNFSGVESIRGVFKDGSEIARDAERTRRSELH